MKVCRNNAVTFQQFMAVCHPGATGFNGFNVLEKDLTGYGNLSGLNQIKSC